MRTKCAISIWCTLWNEVNLWTRSSASVMEHQYFIGQTRTPDLITFPIRKQVLPKGYGEVKHSYIKLINWLIKYYCKITERPENWLRSIKIKRGLFCEKGPFPFGGREKEEEIEKHFATPTKNAHKYLYIYTHYKHRNNINIQTDQWHTFKSFKIIQINIVNKIN